jgi:hypothetical protein
MLLNNYDGVISMYFINEQIGQAVKFLTHIREVVYLEKRPP